MLKHQVGQPSGDVTHDLVGHTVRRSGLEPQIDGVVDIIHDHEKAGRGQGDFRGEKVQAADTGDSQGRGRDRR
jgi:hypothetical protein